MLWKTKPVEGEFSTNGGSDQTKVSNGGLVDGPNHDYQNSMSRSTENGRAPIRRKHGVVIYSFEGDEDKHLLSVELGDSVVIKCEPLPGWYYGWKKYFPESPGLFPGKLFLTVCMFNFKAFLFCDSDTCGNPTQKRIC